ncbi:LOW QUALITY PROTEIN: hypothetical protein MAR_032185 [Mya arenaria]|uniref:SMB domain-containing protein n=1 Tax=Mya arenaria TaxID=6604 RepID=A0ABY7FEA3_MYAAR|nr:LOW QUALITY PROTEIN: hypothetical protein MAR_032185 [Mya arenaria]
MSGSSPVFKGKHLEIKASPHQWGYSGDDDYDPFSVLIYETDMCAELRTCGNDLTYPDKICHCDEVCVLMNDCCDGFITEQTLESISFEVNESISFEVNADQFSCQTVKRTCTAPILRRFAMFSKLDARTKSLCESDFHFEEDLIKITPVSGSYMQMMYKICTGFITPIVPKLTEGSGDRLAGLKLLVNLNLGTFYKDEERIYPKKCNYDEIYDIVYDKCRKVFCPPITFPRKGRCILQAVIEKTHTTIFRQTELYLGETRSS